MLFLDVLLGKNTRGQFHIIFYNCFLFFNKVVSQMIPTIVPQQAMFSLYLQLHLGQHLYLFSNTWKVHTQCAFTLPRGAKSAIQLVSLAHSQLGTYSSLNDVVPHRGAPLSSVSWRTNEHLIHPMTK